MYYIDMPLVNERLRILDSHRAVCSPDWTWDSSVNCWTGYHIWTIATGRGTFETPEGTHALRRGDCFILDFADTYRGSADPGHPLVVPAVHFEPERAKGRHQRLDRKQWPLYRNVGDYAALEGMLMRTIEAHARGRLVEAAHWLTSALYEIRACDTGPARGDPSEPYTAAIAEICARIRDDASRPFSVGEEARRLHLTPDHFIRVFRREAGATPVEFVLQERIAAAKHLLKFSGHPIGRVADLLGYNDQYFFSRQFKKRVGCSPSEYRSR